MLGSRMAETARNMVIFYFHQDLCPLSIQWSKILVLSISSMLSTSCHPPVELLEVLKSSLWIASLMSTLHPWLIYLMSSCLVSSLFSLIQQEICDSFSFLLSPIFGVLLCQGRKEWRGFSRWICCSFLHHQEDNSFKEEPFTTWAKCFHYCLLFIYVHVKITKLWQHVWHQSSASNCLVKFPIDLSLFVPTSSNSFYFLSRIMDVGKVLDEPLGSWLTKWAPIGFSHWIKFSQWTFKSHCSLVGHGAPPSSKNFGYDPVGLGPQTCQTCQA